MNSIKEEDVFHYVLVKEGFKSPADMQMFYFTGNPLLFGCLEDACDDLAYVRNATREDGWEIFMVGLEKI